MPQMANNPGAIKRIKQSERNRVANAAWRSRVRTWTRKTKEAVDAGDVDAAKECARVATSTIDRATRRGIYHKNWAARNKSRLSKKVIGLILESKGEAPKAEPVGAQVPGIMTLQRAARYSTSSKRTCFELRLFDGSGSSSPGSGSTTSMRPKASLLERPVVVERRHEARLYQVSHDVRVVADVEDRLPALESLSHSRVVAGPRHDAINVVDGRGLVQDHRRLAVSIQAVPCS